MARDAVAMQPFVVRGSGGELVAAAIATVSPAIGLDEVQLNGFLVPGAVDRFVAVLDDVAAWSRDRGARTITAHVSDPDEQQLDAWRAASFEQVGERHRVVRQLRDDEPELTPGRIEGAEIHELAERPDLEAGADALWRQSHEDVPSALNFASADLQPMRSELGLAPDERWPTLTLVASTDAGEVVGLGVAVRRYPSDPTRVGHRMTATERSWRGRGVALAIKRELLRRGRASGVRTFEASNDDGNAPMRAINDRLGYLVDYRLVLMRRHL